MLRANSMGCLLLTWGKVTKITSIFEIHNKCNGKKGEGKVQEGSNIQHYMTPLSHKKEKTRETEGKWMKGGVASIQFSLSAFTV